eukprot:TRINITY_DN5177_c0_g1_i1.p1 TRINITY_DN5177_c0_g1~~TRINITY_DN5177_c0_g1_i1.p1  ORF type:complete len:517 (-),score=50.34 TRINITY_DN5177_c0_g1_i1:480-1928(-)
MTDPRKEHTPSSLTLSSCVFVFAALLFGSVCGAVCASIAVGNSPFDCVTYWLHFRQAVLQLPSLESDHAKTSQHGPNASSLNIHTSLVSPRGRSGSAESVANATGVWSWGEPPVRPSPRAWPPPAPPPEVAKYLPSPLSAEALEIHPAFATHYIGSGNETWPAGSERPSSQPTCPPWYRPAVERAISRVIIIVSVNWGALQVSYSFGSFVCALRRLGITNWVYHALDMKAFTFLHRNGLPVFFDESADITGSHGITDHFMGFGASAAYSWLTCGRLLSVYRLMEDCGLHVMLNGNDVIHIRRPYRHFPSPTEFDASVSNGAANHKCAENVTALEPVWDDPSGTFDQYHRHNGDYYIMYSTPKAVNYVRKAFRKCARTGVADQTALFTSLYDLLHNNHSWFPRVRNLHHCVFVNGGTFPINTGSVTASTKGVFGDHGLTTTGGWKPVMVHFNWVGAGDKSGHFDRHGLLDRPCIDDLFRHFRW